MAERGEGERDVLKKRRTYRRQKVCKFCLDKIVLIDFKDIKRLRNFVSDRGKIIPRRISGNCARHQRQLTTAIKRARSIALLSFAAELA
ncbi:MAG TPA: 30S ribosomal protein S18 [Candidatus Methylomirabilis sp.]|nr:30S ribosomal protein S18 [Candidatus Methylomirabilis sp.]